MSQDPPRVVLDTVVFLQALISGRGAAAACIDRFREGRFVLLLSDDTLTEAREVPLRPELRGRYSHLTPERVTAFFDEIEALAVMIRRPPHVFGLPRDPKDEPFTDLAIAGDASFLVTWNERHLTYLMRRDTPEGLEFGSRFPGLTICTPPDFLRSLASQRP
jgi:putative PIN family toxin of toxin-antitoxin system